MSGLTTARGQWTGDRTCQLPPPLLAHRVTDQKFFEEAGGAATFRLLVARFYAGVATDPLLRPLYPEADLSPAEERLALFLIQYWGGPGTYSETRGHPRLRMRHAPFVVGEAERDAWLRHMGAALQSLDLPLPVSDRLWDYFLMAADAMRNTLT